MFRSVVVVLLSAVASQAQPVISGVANNYSYIQPGFPNYGIAPGAIFSIFGTGLSPSTSQLQKIPLPDSLDGVSVKVTVQGATTQPYLYFISPGQIGAVLPSNTAVGEGTIVVTNNGVSSASAPLKVVKAAFGILGINGNGYGPAFAQDAQWKTLFYSNAVNPGEYLTLWGSGLGFAPGSTDFGPPVPVDLTAFPITVEIGGVEATVLYHGRSTYPGLDQINVVVPPGVAGCSVSVAVRSSDIVSNIMTIPVAASGRVCPNDLQSGFGYQTTGFVQSSGSVQLSFNDETNKEVAIQGLPTLPSSHRTFDWMTGHFSGSRSASSSIVATPVQPDAIVSSPTCSVFQFRYPTLSAQEPAAVANQNLDAGSTITVSSPAGDRKLIRSADSFYSAPTNTASILQNGGNIHVENGTGGTDIGAFKVDFELQKPLVWTNADLIDVVDRTKPLTVTWRDAKPKTTVTVRGTSIDAAAQLQTDFQCMASADAGQLTIPASVLLSMPASVVVDPKSSTIAFKLSSLVIMTTEGVLFKAPGLDVGSVVATSAIARAVTYK